MVILPPCFELLTGFCDRPEQTQLSLTAHTAFGIFKQMRPIAFIMPPLSTMRHSGVATFVRQMASAYGKDAGRFRVVEIPHDDYQPAPDNPSLDASAPAASPASTPCLRARAKARIPAALLALGYLRALGRDIRRVRRAREQCRGRIILTNEFGCETLPIALRLAFPFARIVAISHTRPGQRPDADHPVRRWVERMCYRSVSDVLFNSDASRREWARKLRVANIKGRVVHLGIGTPELAVPADYPGRLDGTVDFLCVSRFAAGKGHINLVQAWRMALDRGAKNARLILVGDGDCLDAVKQAVKEQGLDSSVIFMGARDEGACYFNGADVAILLSTEPEAFGLVLLEAMSRGKPVIASRLGGIPEAVADGETGLLVDPFDIPAVADAICRLAGPAGERMQMGGKGRARWAAYFTVDQMVQRYESMLGGEK
jgi:glycosyltransferase involved in cell wall biosynthesis